MTPGWLNPYREAFQGTFAATLLGPLTLAQAPAGGIVTLDQACRQCRIPQGYDDATINDLIQDAAEVCERNIYGEAQLLTATYSVPVRHWWHRGREIKLPRPPLQSVVSVTYTDPNGVTQTLAGPGSTGPIYEVLTAWKEPGRIRRYPFAYFPAHKLDETWPITITFTAGYGAGNIPRVIQRAALLWISSMYRNRGDTALDEKIWDAIQALLDKASYGSY